MHSDSIELYVSPNGDKWLLRTGDDQLPVVRHVPNAASGGRESELPLDAFLALGHAAPQRDALLELVGKLVLRDAPPDRPALPVQKPAVEALLLTAARVRTFEGERYLTNASGFFFARDQRLYLVTSRHVVTDKPSKHFPDRLEIELHVDRGNLGASTWFTLPLYADGVSLWRHGSDDGGEIDVAVVEIRRDRLPKTAVFEAFGPEHLPSRSDLMPTGASVLIIGFPLGFHDSLHHLPVVRQGIIASAFGLRFQGKGCFITDARTHRGTSGAPVVTSAASMAGTSTGTHAALPWRLLGIHSSTIDMGTRNVQVDESLGLNSAWYADILMTLTDDRAPATKNPSAPI